MSISATELPVSRLCALDMELAVVELGRGDPIVFLHGNPTSSYLWRNIMPVMAAQGRCLAPDLPGMGSSPKFPDSGPGRYRFAEHYAYVEAALETLGATAKVTLVLHDWGSALGFHWARLHPDRVRGIAYMEALVRPMTWQEWPDASRALFQALRSGKGEELVLQKNVFIERILPGSIRRRLTDTEMAVYRRPFTEPGEARRPMLSWPRELPIDGEPADVNALVAAYAQWMSQNTLPKLFINAEPGAVLTGAPREFCRRWKNQTEVTVTGVHFVQEDSPAEIAAALADWHHALS